MLAMDCVVVIWWFCVYFPSLIFLCFSLHVCNHMHITIPQNYTCIIDRASIHHHWSFIWVQLYIWILERRCTAFLCLKERTTVCFVVVMLYHMTYLYILALYRTTHLYTKAHADMRTDCLGDRNRCYCI